MALQSRRMMNYDIYYSSDLFVVPIIAFNPLFSTTNFIEVRLFLFVFVLLLLLLFFYIRMLDIKTCIFFV